MEDELNRLVGVEFNPTLTNKQSYITVVLRHDAAHVEKNFRCNHCGKLLFKYYSDIRLIFEGRMEGYARPIDVLCNRCHIIFRIV